VSYDNWKATNPADEWLGPDPDEDEGEPEPSALIITHCAKASPLHRFDYEARLNADDETRFVVGYGGTEQQAITDLIRQLVGVYR
jgi:hypothetical protein